MKNWIVTVLVLMLVLFVALPAFSAGDPNWEENAANAKKAQELKAKGDYLGASRVHPYSLCRASYLWNHACSLIGKKNASNDWVYDVSKKEKNAEALAFLAQAEKEINTPDEVSEGRCKGVDADNLRILIERVRGVIIANGS